mgnify:CR=1 FL=1
MISVLVLTKNEEKDLPGCLESVSWSDDIHVYDSFSTDATLEIAERFGASVLQREFDNWASHQNWGLQNIRFKHDWVFYIDADERMSPGLIEACRQAIKSPRDYVAFNVVRRDFWDGRQLKHVQASALYVRLFKPGSISYERLVNPVTVVDGNCGQVEGFLDHYPFSKGIGHWIRRHDSYSSFEAQEVWRAMQSGERVSLRGLLTGDFHSRRRQLKRLFYRAPFRPAVKFLWLYIAKLGFLDGRAGFRYAVLQSIYEYFITLKLREIRAQPSEANET